MKTDIAQILSLAKDDYLWGNYSYPHAGSCSRLFATLLKRKVNLDQIGHISYYLHIALQLLNEKHQTDMMFK